MPNTTVYPYGTNGELPSSIGIVNDLVTGGANKALAAEQGKVVKGIKDITDEIEINVSQDIDIQSGYYINTSNVDSSRTSAHYTPSLCKLPTNATKILYSGKSWSGVAGIIFYNESKSVLSVYQAGLNNTYVYDAEVTIPSGAVYFRASSYAELYVEYDVKRTYYEDIGNIYSMKEDIERINDIIDTTFSETQHSDNIYNGPSYGLTHTGKTSLAYMQKLFNRTPVVLNQIKWHNYTTTSYSDATVTFAVLKVQETTAKVVNVFKITGVSLDASSDITLDVSSLGVTIPTNGGIGCISGNVNLGYSSGQIVGKGYGMFGAQSGTFFKGNTITMSTFNGNFDDLVITGVYINHNVIVPEESMKYATDGNILYGKKYVAIGDSFTDIVPLSDGGTYISGGPYNGYSEVYPYIIGNRNYMTVLNQGESGSTLNRYIVYSRFSSIPNDVDYITIWFGINDSGHHIEIGNVTDMPSSQIASETDTTTCGAFNWFFKWLLTNRPQAHIGVIVTQYCETERRNAIMDVCKRWGVAYLDLYSPIIPFILEKKQDGVTMDTNAYGSGSLRAWQYRSGNHPTCACHRYQSTFIENFMRSL